MFKNALTSINREDFRIDWRPDLMAGISVAIVAIPQSLAYASLAGLPPHLGLYAALFPTMIAAFVGSSNLLVTGPVAMVSLLTLSTLAPLANPGTAAYIALAAVLAFSVGVVQLLLGVAKMGSLINYVAHTVILGFTNAAALIIIFTQLPKLFGVVPVGSTHPITTFMQIFVASQEILVATLILGLFPLAFILIMKRLSPHFPSVLITVVFGILYSMIINYTGPIVGEIPAGLPSLNLPKFDLVMLKTLALSSLVIAIVSYMEGISIAKSLAAKTNTFIHPSQELIAQGLANVASSFSGSFPVAGSFSRTAINYASGAKTYGAAIFSGLAVVLVLVFFTPIFYYLPQATLAAIIIAAVINLLNFHEPLHLLKVRRREGIVAVTTFVSTLLFAPHLDYGIMVGIILAVIMHMHRAAHPRIQIFYLRPGRKNYGELHFESYPNKHNIMAVTIDWSLSFANASFIEEVIVNSLDNHPEIDYVMILGRSINHIDHSAEEVLKHLTHRLKAQNVTLVFTGIKPHIKEQLRHTHFFEFIDPKNVFDHASAAITAINHNGKKK